MSKLTSSELRRMIKNKIISKGFSEEDIDENLFLDIENHIKQEVKKSHKPTSVNEDDNDSKKEEEEVVDVDISKDNSLETPGEEPEIIEKTSEIDEEEQELYKKEGELEEKEKALIEKEQELKRKEEELRTKEEELKYEPTIPEKLRNLGSEKLFVFDENILSAGAEKLSNTDMNLVENPEEKTNMKTLWIKEGKRDAEIYKVNFEKIGKIIFDPFEGISDFIKIYTPEKKINSSDEESNVYKNNVIDSIEPIKNVSQPLTNDMQLKIEKEDNEYIKSIEDIMNNPEFKEKIQNELLNILNKNGK
jgi:hypothetical protein